MEERHSWVVGDEVEFDFLEAAEHHDVLEDARGCLAANPYQFEAMAMEMQRVDVVARVAEF